MYADLQTYINNNALTISYDVRPGETETNYRNNTVTVPFTYSYGVNSVVLDVYRQIEMGLQATGKKDKWKVSYDDFSIDSPTVVVYFELKNDSGKLLGTQAVALRDGTFSDAIRNAQRDIERNREQQAKTSASNKVRFVHSNPSSRSRDDSSAKMYIVEFSNIPYTEITDSLSFGIAKIEVYQKNSYSSYRRGNPDITNPPFDVTILGKEQAQVTMGGSARVIESAEPVAWGSYKKGGRGPAGGIVFEENKKGVVIDGKTYHYFEFSPLIADFSSETGKRLASMLQTSGHTVKKIGSFKVNNKWGGGFGATNEILRQASEKGYSDIVNLISGYSYGGFSDWYIPGDDEIDSIGYWFDWGSAESAVDGREELAYLFTWEGAISLRYQAYQGSQYTSFNLADFKGYWDIPRADCILFVRAF